MGLDNGIYIKHTPETEKIKELSHFKETWGFNVEVTYWRKCWNVRADIFSIIGLLDTTNDSDTPVKLEHIDSIIALLKSYNKDNWECSIWEYDEIKPRLKQQIKNLKLLKKLMQKYSNLEAYFYDCY
jgi:hypothetical protein